MCTQGKFNTTQNTINNQNMKTNLSHIRNSICIKFLFTDLCYSDQSLKKKNRMKTKIKMFNTYGFFKTEPVYNREFKPGYQALFYTAQVQFILITKEK